MNITINNSYWLSQPDIPLEEIATKDYYGRTVAEIFLGEGFINAEMVRAGHAWHYQRYSGNCPNRGAIVQAANSTQLTGMPPWEFRKRN